MQRRTYPRTLCDEQGTKRKYVLGAVRRRRRAFLLRSITECGAKQKGGTEPPRG